jgi:hypothetical protein
MKLPKGLGSGHDEGWGRGFGDYDGNGYGFYGGGFRYGNGFHGGFGHDGSASFGLPYKNGFDGNSNGKYPHYLVIK